MFARFLRRIGAAMIITAAAQALAFAEQEHFGPFTIDRADTSVIVLDGKIDAGSALNFRRVLDAAEDAKALVLNSPGGIVQMALLIADDVYDAGLATYIPEEAICYSACSIVFFAGDERRAEGELGVHQLSSASADLESAQFTISDIIDVLNEFDTPTEVLTAMFRTPPNDMYVFSDDEVRRFINRGSAAGGSEDRPKLQSRLAARDKAENAADSALAPDGETSVLSDLDDLVSQPTQLALYAGLDFYGADLDSFRATDVVECARRCLAQPQQCKAFTFNTNENARRGPNCFLKSARGQLDGNADALSDCCFPVARGCQTPFTSASLILTSAPSRMSIFRAATLQGGPTLA